MPTSVTSHESPPRHAGVGGWLQFFVFGWCLAIAISGAQTFEVQGAARSVQGAYTLLLLAIGAFGFAAIGNRHWWAPRFWALAIMGNALLNVVIVVGAAYFAPSTSDEEAASGLFRQVLGCVVWVIYWARSARVRNTFGSTAFSRRVRQ